VEDFGDGLAGMVGDGIGVPFDGARDAAAAGPAHRAAQPRRHPRSGRSPLWKLGRGAWGSDGAGADDEVGRRRGAATTSSGVEATARERRATCSLDLGFGVFSPRGLLSRHSFSVTSAASHFPSFGIARSRATTQTPGVGAQAGF
jgi:hypothetical protein